MMADPMSETPGAAPPQGRTNPFFYGWFVVAILFVVSIIDGGFTYIFSAFLKPLSEEFGWTRAQTSGGFSLYLLAAGTLLPVWGWLADRVGAARKKVTEHMGSLWSKALLQRGGRRLSVSTEGLRELVQIED